MREEFHGIDHGGGIYTYKQLYNWNSVNANVWLPSLCELVGYTGTQNATTGCYKSAMQGLNITNGYYTDVQGGVQFAYFQQFNTSGGGEAIMKACNQQLCWLRSSYAVTATDAWRTTDAQNLNAPIATVSRAVHPAVLYNP